MNKKSIVYNHIKKINEARKIGKKGCYSCIFNMSNRELSSALDIEEDIILSPCPLAAYTLFTYGFINKNTYITATKKMYEENYEENYEEHYNSLSKIKKYSIVVGVQRNMVDCIVGCNQECHITEVNKI